MLNWKLINWTIGLAFVGLNLFGIGLSHSRRQAEALKHQASTELRNKQANQIAAWHGASATSLGATECRGAIRRLGPTVEVDKFSDIQELGWEGLSESESTDLVNAIHGLMQAYRRDGARHVLNYMGAREESLDVEKMTELRNYLVKRHGLDEQELIQKSLPDQFQIYWDALDSQSAWKALLPSHSGVHIWESDSVSTEEIGSPSTLCKSDRFLWQNRMDRYHHFSHATDSVTTQLEEHGNIKVADLRLIIEHDLKTVHTICPYVIRFWYSESRSKWIPHLLCVYKTSNDIPSSLLF